VLKLVGNVTTYAVFPVVGALAFQRLGPVFDDGSDLTRASAVVALFMSASVLNFLLIAIPNAVVERRGIAGELREVLLPLMPSQLAAAVLTAAVDAIYRHSGLATLALAGVVALVYQHLLRTTMRSVEHARELETRTHELAGLQVGLITTVLRTLSMRDKMTARHSAAVARYARQVAAALGLDEQSQETIHTAGLLHDIGKFIFPDSILLSSRRLTDEEFEIVKRHPEQGAKLVGRLQGYEAVAEIIHAHHERVDGRGYPRGLIGADIPIGARIIAVCDTYDVMTARDSYREPVTPGEAIAELRRVAGGQLDPLVVETFVSLIERRGVAFRHNDDADFEAELSLERRVAEYARPQLVA
jgi:putative nucleotidyltransferase with HDIG domain